MAKWWPCPANSDISLKPKVVRSNPDRSHLGLIMYLSVQLSTFFTKWEEIKRTVKLENPTFVWCRNTEGERRFDPSLKTYVHQQLQHLKLNHPISDVMKCKPVISSSNNTLIKFDSDPSSVYINSFSGIFELTGYGHHTAIAVALCVLHIIKFMGKKSVARRNLLTFFNCRINYYIKYMGGAKLLSVVTSAIWKKNLIQHFKS